jgi:GT2 family glycosyltransferase
MYRILTDHLSWELMQAVLGEKISPTKKVDQTSLSPISVIVCTRNRPNQLKRCLQALLALDYPVYEIIVVNNAPDHDETAELVAHLPVRYLCEEQPGLGRARNCGIKEANHPIIAFIDDDAHPDPGWLEAINRAFAEPEVMAVTGLVVPAELETKTQIRLEYSYGLGRGLKRRIIRREQMSKQALLSAQDFGSGANMAFRRELFERIGPFDVALGIGTPGGGGSDIEMFHRLVAQGYTLVYEPMMLVWHMHRRDHASLQQTAFNRNRAFGAYLLTCARRRSVGRSVILKFAIDSWLKPLFRRRPDRPGGFPRRLIIYELAGAVLSPLFYMIAQARAKQISLKGQKSEKIKPSPPGEPSYEKL